MSQEPNPSSQNQKDWKTHSDNQESHISRPTLHQSDARMLKKTRNHVSSEQSSAKIANDVKSPSSSPPPNRDYKSNYGTTNRRRFGAQMTNKTPASRNQQHSPSLAPVEKAPTTNLTDPLQILEKPLPNVSGISGDFTLDELVQTMFKPLHKRYDLAAREKAAEIQRGTKRALTEINVIHSKVARPLIHSTFIYHQELYSQLSAERRKCNKIRENLRDITKSMRGYNSLHLQRFLVGPDLKPSCASEDLERIMDPERARYFDIGIFPGDIASKIYPYTEILEVSREIMEFRLIGLNQSIIKTDADYEESLVITRKKHSIPRLTTPDALQPELIRTGRQFKPSVDGPMTWGRGWQKAHVVVDERKRILDNMAENEDAKKRLKRAIEQMKAQRRRVEALEAGKSQSVAPDTVPEDEEIDPVVNEEMVHTAWMEDTKHGDILSVDGKYSAKYSGMGSKKGYVKGDGGDSDATNHVDRGAQVIESLLKKTKGTKDSDRIPNQDAIDAQDKMSSDGVEEKIDGISPEIGVVSSRSSDFSSGGIGNSFLGHKTGLFQTFRKMWSENFRKFHTSTQQPSSIPSLRPPKMDLLNSQSRYLYLPRTAANENMQLSFSMAVVKNVTKKENRMLRSVLKALHAARV